jgi:CHAD domain-containing protein
MGRRWQGIVRATRQTFLPHTEPSPTPEKKDRPSLPDVVNLLQPRWETVQKSLEAAKEYLEAAQGSLETADAHADEAGGNELLHAARKDIKVLRYSVEAVATVLGAGATAIIQPSMVLQRLLGEQHDSVAGQEWIRNLAETPGVELLDIQALQSMEQRRLMEAEVGLRAAISSSPIPEPRRMLPG